MLVGGLRQHLKIKPQIFKIQNTSIYKLKTKESRNLNIRNCPLQLNTIFAVPATQSDKLHIIIMAFISDGPDVL